MRTDKFDIEERPADQYTINRQLEHIDERITQYNFIGKGLLILAGICFLLQFLGLRIIQTGWWVALLFFATPFLYCLFDQKRHRSYFESIDDQGKFELKILMDNSRIVTKYVNYVMSKEEDEGKNREITWGELEMLKTEAYEESLSPEKQQDTYYWE